MPKAMERFSIIRKSDVTTDGYIKILFLKVDIVSVIRHHTRLKDSDYTIKSFGKVRNALSLVEGQQVVWI